MNVSGSPSRLRWTLISFAMIGILVWVSVVLFLQAATPVVNDLLIDLENVLTESATALDESADAVDNGGTLIGEVEPGLDSTASGMAAASEALIATKDSITEISALFASLGTTLDSAGTTLSFSPALADAGQSLHEAGSTMTRISENFDTLAPNLDEVITRMDEVREVVIITADNTRPLTGSLDDTESALVDTGVALRNAAGQVKAVRTSGSLRTAIVLLFFLLGTISISLGIIAASRLTQMRLLQHATDSARAVPQAATDAVRRVGDAIDR